MARIPPADDLAPGAAVAFDALWDQTGEVGDGILRLRVVSPIDAQGDNVLEQDAFVFVGGTGLGGDLLNQRLVVGVLPVLVRAGDLHVGVYHHERRVGVYAARYTHSFFTDHSASEWVRAEVSESGSLGTGACFRSTFDACPDPAPSSSPSPQACSSPRVAYLGMGSSRYSAAMPVWASQTGESARQSSSIERVVNDTLARGFG